jgi:hypothetical protein
MFWKLRSDGHVRTPWRGKDEAEEFASNLERKIRAFGPRIAGVPPQAYGRLWHSKFCLFLRGSACGIRDEDTELGLTTIVGPVWLL